MDKQEQRRTSFDNIAELYDEVRPQYPLALVEDLIKYTSYELSDWMLEVGCGTGKATSMFAKKSCKIIALEPGEAMADITAKKLTNYPDCKVEVAKFEDWQSVPKRFQVVYAAQSFHWIRPEVKYQKSANLLTDNGHLAIFWNNKSYDNSQIRKELDNIYE